MVWWLRGIIHDNNLIDLAKHNPWFNINKLNKKYNQNHLDFASLR